MFNYTYLGLKDSCENSDGTYSVGDCTDDTGV
jgi:hypothetical protein